MYVSLLGKFNFLKMVVQSILYSDVFLEIAIIFGCGFVISLVEEAKHINQKVYCILVKQVHSFKAYFYLNMVSFLI